MDATAAGVRLYLRQAALRQAAGRPRPAGARTFPRRARLPGQVGPVPRKPRRATGGGHVRPAGPHGGGGPHVSVTRLAVLPPGSVPGPAQADFAAPRTRARRADRRGDGEVLRPLADGPAAASRPRWRLAAARLRPGLGRQLDVGLLHRVRLGRSGRRAVARGGELLRPPEPVRCPPAICGSERPTLAAAGPIESGDIRSQRRRPAIAQGCTSTPNPGKRPPSR